MFKEKRFKLKYSVDKRGRPVNFSSSEDLKRYYDTNERSDESSDDDAEEAVEESGPETAAETGDGDDSSVKEEKDATTPSTASKSARNKKPDQSTSTAAETSPAKKTQASKSKDLKKPKKKSTGLLEEEEEEVLDEEVRGRLTDLTVDYARGGGVLVEDSSSDDESEPEEAELEHDWAELDRDAPRIDDSEVTARLAVCNMDWDRIKAQDLMVLLSSFLPSGGVIQEVAIYPSDYGKERMAVEEEHGPPELFNKEDGGSDDSSDDERPEPKDDTETTDLSQMEYVRRYQLSRLRYYYAVVSCDCAASAAKLYDECEGLEFESSASRVDLRFVPEEMTFDETPRERCTSVPESGKYRPSQFVTTALQQRLVRFTWDETDVDRQEAVRRAALGTGDVEEADIRAYLASDSSDEEEADAGEELEPGGGDREESEKARIAKYRALLAGSDDDEKAEDDDKEGEVEMEITWGVGIKEKTEELVKKRTEQKDQLTPWEQYVDKQKTKGKDKKKSAKAAAKAAKEAQESSSADSDSDIPSDVADDPFFKEELDARRREEPQRRKTKTKREKARDAAAEDVGDQDQLALLTMADEEDDQRQHFNFKQIVKDEAAGGKKKKWKKKRKPAEEDKAAAPADDFQVDVADPRFAQLYDSAKFHVDPSDARFRRTTGMEELVKEKQRRVVTGRTPGQQDEPATKRSRLESAPVAESQTTSVAESAPAPPSDLGSLVSAIKTKTKRLQAKQLAAKQAKGKAKAKR